MDSGSDIQAQLRKWDTTQAVRPVLVYQLVDAQQKYSKANFTVGGHEVKYVTTVASVVSVTHSTSKISFELEDGSKLGGRIMAHRWYLDIPGSDTSIEEKTEAIGIAEHQYVRVIGTLSRFHNRNSLDVVDIRTVTHPHEVDFHFLEAFVVNMVYKRGHLPNEMDIQTSPKSRIVHDDDATPVAEFKSVMNFTHEMSHSPAPTLTDLTVLLNSDTDTDFVLVGPSDIDQDPRKGKGKDSSRGSDDGNDETSSQLSRLSLSLDQSDHSSPIDIGPSRSVPSSSFTFVHSTSSQREGIVNWHDRTPALHHEVRVLPQSSTNSISISPPHISTNPIPHSPSYPPFPEATPAKRKRDPYSHLSSVQRSIVLYIQNTSHYLAGESAHRSWEGVHVNAIVTAVERQYGSNMTPGDVMEEMGYLINEGHIYCTIDDFHVNVT